MSASGGLGLRPASQCHFDAISGAEFQFEAHKVTLDRSQLTRRFNPAAWTLPSPNNCAPPLLFDRTSAASGYSTSRATSSRARWNGYATAKHSTPVPAAAFFYFTQGAWRFHPRCGPGRGEPASSVTAHCRGAATTAVFATGYTPRSVGPARHLDTPLPASFVTAQVLSRSYYYRSFCYRLYAALSGPCTSPLVQVPLVVPTRLCTPTTPPSGADSVKLGRSW